MKITTSPGRLIRQYPGQYQPQDRYIEVSKNGELSIRFNPEIGNSVPSRVYHGIVRRIHGEWTTKAEAREFIRDYQNQFQALVDGMDEHWDGNNYIGTLTDAAKAAKESLDYAAYNHR